MNNRNKNHWDIHVVECLCSLVHSSQTNGVIINNQLKIEPVISFLDPDGWWLVSRSMQVSPVLHLPPVTNTV